MPLLPVTPSSSVWPSGSDLETWSAPTVPPAPARLSTTTVCPVAFVKWGAIRRATWSVALPAPGMAMLTAMQEAMLMQEVMLVLAVMLAWATTRYVEYPIRFGRFKHSAWVIAACVVLLALLGGAGYATWKQQGYPGHYPAMQTLLADLKHRHKKFIIGPLQDGEMAAAMALNPFGVIIK